jgi:hypothetical protein
VKVKEQIEVLKATIQQLEALDPELQIEGHTAYPDNGYSGDLDKPIHKIDVEYEEEDGKPVWCALGIYF